MRKGGKKTQRKEANKAGCATGRLTRIIQQRKQELKEVINKQVTAVLIKRLNQVKQNEEQNNITETLLSKEDIVPFGFYHLFHLNSQTKA